MDVEERKENTKIEIKKAIMKSWSKLLLDEDMIDIKRYNDINSRIEKITK